LLGFHEVAAFSADARDLCQALDATHNKAGDLIRGESQP
jgi:hypothetical protein